AIYLDDGMSNVTVSGNISVGGGEYFVHYHGAQNIVVTNNVIYASAGGSELGFYQSSSYGAGMSGDTFSHNIVYSSGNWHSTFWNISGWNSGTDAGLSLHDNMYYSATGQTPPNTTITDTNRYLVDPQFVNVSSGNYALQSTSPAYAELSWVDIPSDQGPLPYLS
ncbi:MAG TPA: hypothetical protein VLC51_05250, partial [Nitrospira sp.]|nr:hypothetical protein [Nitrospira sp.]